MPQPHPGHKALFLDRLDVGVKSGSAETPRLVPFAHLLVYNRNRTYNPQLGRFNQIDPNQTAITLLHATAHHGRGMGAIALAFDLEGLYGDGANLYQYLGSNPWTRSDPLGLSWDPFDEIDRIIAEHAGSQAAFLSQLGQSAAAVAVVSATIVSVMPFPGTAILGELALYALGESSEAQLATAAALGLVPGGKLAMVVGNIGSSAWRGAVHYAGRFTGALARGARGLASRARQWVRRKPGSACGCFVAGTVVWTAVGLMPIEDVREGDLVQVKDEHTGEISLEPVVAEIVTENAALVELVLVHESGSSETLRTTDEHPFRVEGRGWVRADALSPGEEVETLTGQAIIRS